jgi:site-specific DNA-methyltransferase (adenine-specific)
MNFFLETSTVSCRLYHGDCFEAMHFFIDKKEKFELVFADPPYFLSNGGISCHAGKMVSVNKGNWDIMASFPEVQSFHRAWLKLVFDLLSDNGTLWVSATQHSIFIIGNIIQELGYEILNVITWEKPNPPPNLSCRYFTHSTELLIWAKKSKKIKHCFNYELMRRLNGGKQMKSVWSFTPPTKSEKKHGKHPTQKPIKLLERIILSSSRTGDTVFDPFAGSSTTGVAAITHERNFVGIERDNEFIELSARRLSEILVNGDT